MANIITSLSQSFHTVPPAAIPAMLDCILTCTSSLTSSSLFDSLLSHFSNFIKEINDDGKKMGSEQCATIVSYLKGLSHLMKKMACSVALERFIWEGFIPLMKMVHLYEKEILHEIIDYLLEVVSETNNWELIETILAPVLLRSVGISMDMDQSEDKTVIKWNKHSVFQSLRESQKLGIRDDIPILSLTLSCYILSCLLDAATASYHKVLNAETFCGHLIWDLCVLTIQMLSQSLDHRSCAVSLLCPSIFKAFTCKGSFEVCIQGERCYISRQLFFMRMWKCSSVLFGLGPSERRAAYSIISLYLSYFPSVDRFHVERGDEAEEFDIRAEKAFWDEIKRGLVEKEGLIRKQSLYILKKVVLLNEEHLKLNASEKKSRQRGSVPRGMSKRDVWAEEEAKSLGVGQTFASDDKYLSEKQKWEAFILLYEMLDEYGTHLVEAAWNHQIMLLLQSCVGHETIMDLKVSNHQINVLGSNFDWIAILWERGLFHDNPHVRCLIMKSFLDIEWKNHGNCKDLFPEHFVLGAFVQGLNDPVHHKDFGVKGVHASKTIEGASKFLYQYCTFLCERELILFLCKLASVARHQSLGRAGLMSLSECIFSASKSSKLYVAEGYSESPNGDRNCVDALSKLNGMQYPRSQLCTEKTDLFDSLRFLVENSKQHFNPHYRLRVCEKVLEAAMSVLCVDELSLETLLHFIAALPREFTDSGDSLRIKLQKWFICKHKNYAVQNSSSFKMVIEESLHDFPRRFTTHQYKSSVGVHYDDDDLAAWCSEAERWARVFFLNVKEEHQLEPLFKFIKEKGVTICGTSDLGECIPVKFLILLLSLVQELEIIRQSTDNYNKPKLKIDSETELIVVGDKGHLIAENFANVFLVILEDLISFSESSCSRFWSHLVFDSQLPGAVTGKLGGPSQRRLSSPITTAILQAVLFPCFCLLH